MFSISLSWDSSFFFPVDFMGGDAKCVQHKIVLPMYVSYTSIPTSTANTTMKSTKLLTNPYLDVTTTSVATFNLDKSINDYNNQTLTNNRNLINSKNSRYSANSEFNTGATTNTNSNMTISENGDNNNSEIGRKCVMSNFYSMSHNPFVNRFDEFGGDRNITKKLMTNPLRSHIQKRNNSISCRSSSKLCAISNGYIPRSTRYPDSDDTRSSSIDYNFNYVKFRSPLIVACKMTPQTQYRDSSSTSATTECSMFLQSSPEKLFEDNEQKYSLVLPKVHNHPNCQCSIQNLCPFAIKRFNASTVSAAENVTHQNSIYTAGMHDREFSVPSYPYRRRDLHTNDFNFDHNKVNISSPENDHIDDFHMKRTFSHDRLYSQRRTVALTARNRTRPISYCSNVNHYPTKL